MSVSHTVECTRITPSNAAAACRGGVPRTAALVLMGLAGWCTTAQAQYACDFEPPFAASSSGTSINGQQGWFTPAVAGSVDGLVTTYTDNIFLLPANPTGGSAFLGQRSGGGTAFSRAQHEGLSLPNVTVICYDMAGAFDGTAPTAQNLGSFSMQPEPNSAAPTIKGYIQLNTWVDINNPTSWSASFLPYNDLNVQFAQPGAFAGPEWQNLPLNHWFRLCTTVDFDQNRITSVSITDLATGITTTAEPVGWFLGGGINSTLPIPTGVRFFAGGGLGNIMGWDNLTAEAGGGCGSACIGDFNCDGGIDGSDVEAFFAVWEAGDSAADVNDDGGVDGADVELFFTRWEGGC